MKRIILIALLSVLAVAVHAQNAKIVGVICPECGVYLKGDDAKHFDDPAYHNSGCTFVKKSESESSSSSSSSTSNSTHLKEYAPLPEVKSELNVPNDRYELIYKTGDGEHMITCPSCGSVFHESWCLLARYQKMAKDARAKAMAASTLEAREAALSEFHTAEFQLNMIYENAVDVRIQKEQEEAKRQTQTAAQQNTAPNPTPSGYQHLSSVDIKNGYDKKLTFGYNATAYCKTAPNGTERWVLYDIDGQEVGQFSKIELADAGNGEDEYFLVRDDNGQWGIYGRGGGLMCEPRYESVKLLTALQGEGRRPFFDVARRFNGQVLHGLVDPFIVSPGDGEITQCVFEQIELIDRSPAPYGVLAKVKSDGKWGVIDTENHGDIIIPPKYSYINTYFTLKGGMYLIVGDGNGLGAYHAETMEEVVPVTNGYSLDKVKVLLTTEVDEE